MITSFTFNGVSCESLGLTYAPDNKDMYVWSPTTRNIHEQQFEGHHGGYFFGASRKWKDFVLRCFYAQKCEDTEEFDVMNGFFTQLYRVFEVGTTGQLTFSNRPWIYYDATIVNVDASQIRGTKGGFVIITARAYYPYGLCSQLELPNKADKFYKDMWHNSSMIHNHIALFPISYNIGQLVHGNTKEYHLMNPGTVTADVAVKIKYNPVTAENDSILPSGVTITNKTTGQRCRISAAPGIGKWYVCNSKNGNCFLEDETTKTANYMYHDYGFIQLAPATNLYECIYSAVSPASISIVDKDKRLSGQNFTGMYFSLDGGDAAKITDSDYSDGALGLSFNYGSIPMDHRNRAGRIFYGDNTITIDPDAEVQNLSIMFEYKPTFN